jgi:hypothetical protein
MPQLCLQHIAAEAFLPRTPPQEETFTSLSTAGRQLQDLRAARQRSHHALPEAGKKLGGTRAEPVEEGSSSAPSSSSTTRSATVNWWPQKESSTWLWQLAQLLLEHSQHLSGRQRVNSAVPLPWAPCFCPHPVIISASVAFLNCVHTSMPKVLWTQLPCQPTYRSKPAGPLSGI